MTQTSKENAADRATEGLVPFYGKVMDVCMVDKTQAQMFSSVGRTRCLFQGLAEWPSLEQALSRASRDCLHEVGEDRWSAEGGVYGEDGNPTCLLTSKLAARVVRVLAADPGGVLWTDESGGLCAVRLVPVGARDPEAYFGFALSWQGGGPLLEDITPTKRGRAGNKAARRSLERRAHRLRLAARAEQILWVIHWAVLSQRRSVVLLPDKLLAQVVWGAEKEEWPQDWRREILKTLLSLTNLRLDVLRLSSEGWRPRFGMQSLAVATVEQLWVTRPEENHCRPDCPMWGSTERHDHFYVQAGYGFLGALEKYVAKDESDYRTYDFKKVTDVEVKEELKEARKAGQIVSVSVPTALFGRAKWAGLPEERARIIDALMGEVTRPLPPKKSGRADHAFVLHGNRVPGLKPRSEVVCPFLRAKGRHVAFCGNGDRRGMGYQIVGQNGRGWLYKSGYRVPHDSRELAREVRSFLKHLAGVCDLIGLTAVGLDPTSGQWFDIEGMMRLSHGHKVNKQLLSVHLRVYGQEDYLRRCREFFAEMGGFRAIPDGEIEWTPPPNPAGGTDLSTRIRLTGIKQVELAKVLGVSQPCVSQILNNDRPWPEKLVGRAEAFLAERTGFTGSAASEE